MPTLLVTGANRGIGLELARSYAADGWRVIGTVRDSAKAEDLTATGAQVETLDTADPASITALAGHLAGQPIDLLIANAGVFRKNDRDPADWLDTLKTNTIGPVLLAQALHDNVTASGLKRMIAITSGMGSIADASGGAIAYRTSKAALNMAWKCLSIEYARDGIVAAVINPGWVKTDMGGAGAAIAPSASIKGIRRVIDALTPADAGRFLSWDGKTYDW